MAAPEQAVLADPFASAVEADAVEQLVRAHARFVFQVAYSVLRHAHDAEDVVQETWISVLRGLSKFEGRSSLKTWIFHILTNRAKTRGQREGRMVPFSDMWEADSEPAEPAVDPARFNPPGHDYAGWWISHPRSWDDIPESRLLAQEAQAQIEAAIAALPPSQQTVITLRDVEGWMAEEVCNILGISETNQRVLLHRARSKVRRALEHYLAEV